MRGIVSGSSPRQLFPVMAAVGMLLMHSAAGWGQFRDITPGKGGSENGAPPAESLVPEPIAADAGTGENAEAEKSSASAFLDENLLIDDVGIRPLRFRGVLVGETREKELVDLWGEPIKSLAGEHSRVLKYRIRPFRQVDVTLVDDQVISILIHLDGLLEPTHCIQQLRMTQIEPVVIPDEYGNAMGMAFPERGVLFSYDTHDPEALISKIQLEAVSPEPFLLRAEYDFEQRFEAKLADIDQALEMNSRYARAHWLHAEVLGQTGRYHDALESAGKAVHYDPENLQFRLTKAALLAKNGSRDTALRETKHILELEEVPTEFRSAAEALLGDLILEGSPGEAKKAMEHHLKAIELAATLANDRNFETRRLAKRTLINTHLAVARDISLGEFQKQEEVVPKWLGRSRALVNEYVDRDQGDPALMLPVYRQILATAADLRNPENPERVIDELLEKGHKLIESAEDTVNQNRLEWWLGIALAEGVRLQRLRGDAVSALEIADEAVTLLQQSARQRQSTPEQRYLVGRLYFHIGSIHAVQRKDHEEAIVWYKKAEPLLMDELPLATLADPGTHGEMFVSIAVSYWETGNHQKAIDLTEFGTDVLQRAVVEGVLMPDVLTIPYGNLAAMHKKAGHDEDAKAFAELASSIKTETKKR